MGRRKKQSSVGVGYYETKKEVLETLSKLAGQSITERYNMTFTDVYEGWKAEHFREIGIQGKEAYETAYKYMELLYDRKFRTLRTADFQPVIDSLVAKGRNYNTVSKDKQLLTQMTDWAVREEITTNNFAKFIKLPQSSTKEKETFTPEEIAALESSQDDAAKIILMLLSTGMRIGKLFKLPITDYHGKYVVGGEKTAAGKNRIIPIRPEGRAYFEYFATLSDRRSLLLDGYEGNHSVRNFREREYYPLLKSLGINRKTPHATRHTYASRAVREGMPREVLQKILGHSSYTTTADVYVHADVDALVAAVEPVTNTSLTNKQNLKKEKTV